MNIADLGEETCSYFFSMGDGFLQAYSGGLAPEGVFSAKVELTKMHTLIEANFHINGTFRLTCDRSLRAFDHPVELKKKMIFKYGDEYRELSDDMIIFDRSSSLLEVGQLLYDWIGVSIPIRKLHPDCIDDDTMDGVVYSTSSSAGKDKDSINAVWKKLVSHNKRS